MRHPSLMRQRLPMCKRWCGGASSVPAHRGLIGKSDVDVMGGWEHGGGFSLDASVCIGGDDRSGLERLLRYCARPPFALEYLQQLDAEHLMEQLAI